MRDSSDGSGVPTMSSGRAFTGVWSRSGTSLMTVSRMRTVAGSHSTMYGWVGPDSSSTAVMTEVAAISRLTFCVVSRLAETIARITANTAIAAQIQRRRRGGSLEFPMIRISSSDMSSKCIIFSIFFQSVPSGF